MQILGFKIVESKQNVVVPSYFEPFENQNNEILFAYKNINNLKSKYLVFKGDDQDRPNLF